MSAPFDVLLFDVGGVLVDVRRDLARADWERRTGCPGASFDDAVFGAGRKDAFDRGDLDESTFFDAALARLDPADGDREALRDALDGAFRTIVQPRPWVAEALAALEARFRLALLSNIDPVHAEVFAALPIAARFEVTAFSFRLRARKPEPAAYRRALALLGDPLPARVLFLDDHVANVDAARALGLRAVHTPDEDTLRAAIRALDADLAPAGS